MAENVDKGKNLLGIYLLLGSNLGDGPKNLEEARSRIDSIIGPIVKASSIFRTEPWQMNNAPWFSNQALEIKSDLKPLELLKALKRIEFEMGRRKAENTEYESRIIDIDILYYNAIVMKSSTLTIPHNLMHERAFTLEPLAQIASDRIHPILGMDTVEMLEALKITKH